MSLNNVLSSFILIFILTVKCHATTDYLLNISMGITNARTVIACGSSIQFYLSFDPTQVRMCPYASIQENYTQLFDINISKTNLSELRKLMTLLLLLVFRNDYVFSLKNMDEYFLRNCFNIILHTRLICSNSWSCH